MGQIKTPLGRIIWGHPMKHQFKTDDDNNQVLKDGQPVKVWSFGLAIPKDQFAPVWADMAATAQAMFGQGIPQNFAWKYKDGDTALDKNGQPLNRKEGYAGHYILTVSTEAFAPSCYKWDGSKWQQLTEEQIKTGDYCAVGLNIVAHQGQGKKKPGLYLNPTAIELVYYGQAIFNGPDPVTSLGAAPTQYAMPAGASATPMSGAPANAPAMPQPGMPMGGAPAMPGQMPAGAPMQQPQYAPPPVQQPQYAPPPMQPAQPAYDYVQNVTGQPYPQQPVQMPAPGGMPQMPGAPAPQYAPQPAMPGQMPAMPGMMPQGR